MTSGPRLVRTPGSRSPRRYARTVLRSWPRCRAIAEIDQPRPRSACASTSSSHESIQAPQDRRDDDHRDNPEEAAKTGAGAPVTWCPGGEVDLAGLGNFS